MLFCYYVSVLLLEVRYCDTSSVALFAQECFGYVLCFVFTYELQDSFYIFVENAFSILVGIPLNL
jgi:hypothetical protein